MTGLLLWGCSDDNHPTMDHGVGPADQAIHDGVGPSGDAVTPDLSAPGDGPVDGPGPGPDGPSVSSCTGPGLSPGEHVITLQFGGLQRSYRLYVPKGYNNATHTPLVLNFHGVNSNAWQQVLFSGMNAASDKHGFVLAYPVGVQSSWNAGLCCGGAATLGLDDVGFARAVVADIQKKLCIDGKRIYAAGMSNGAMLSHRLACEASDLFAAIGPVAGGLVLAKPCAPARAVPVIHFHGSKDTIVQYNSGVTTVAGWVKRNGCTDAQPTQVYNKGVASCDAWTQCKDGAEVVFCTIKDGGHCWFGQAICPFGDSTTDISANEEMWSLFQKHPLP